MLVEMSDITSQVSLHADPNSKVWSESDSWWHWFCPSDSLSENDLHEKSHTTLELVVINPVLSRHER